MLISKLSPLALGVLVPAALVACRSAAESDAPGGERSTRKFASEMVEGEPMYSVLPKGEIAAIDEPSFVSAEEADAFFLAGEPVLGVLGRNGTAKAYSAWQLDSHEIVNDSIDGDPIAATW